MSIGTVAKPAAVAAVAICIGACGSGPSDKEQIRSLVDGYVKAFAAHDGKRACSLLTTQAQERIQAAAGILRGRDCSQTLTTVSNIPTAKGMHFIRYLKAGKIVVEGNQAGVVIEPAAPGSKPTKLLKVDGKWLIDGSVAASK